MFLTSMEIFRCSQRIDFLGCLFEGDIFAGHVLSPDTGRTILYTQQSKAIFHHSLTPKFHSVDDHVVLLGEVAHSMTAHYGHGAGMDFEDGFVMARLLSGPAVMFLPISTRQLHAWDFVRVPRASAIIPEESRALSVHVLGPHGRSLRG